LNKIVTTDYHETRKIKVQYVQKIGSYSRKWLQFNRRYAQEKYRQRH